MFELQIDGLKSAKWYTFQSVYTPFCNADIFQLYLDEFSKQNPNEFKIIVLDNGAFHKAKVLKVPNNIAFIFLPPYSQELNPAENMWARFKRGFTNRLFKTLDEVSDFIGEFTKKLTPQSIQTTCEFEYAVQVLFGLNNKYILYYLYCL
ncbi:transposase [Arachidicoccus soli]|uniref:Tc1-like transposase DDE domain-containing protein n=1 Tax=Arachidicoccus soli TaxID=2341117 RepID=A0A386HR72_9BACT|nr:transposase [Arachidicoccus soli]AYD48139.1 hypothetical protein D6B99_11355 [Arachidicoccus soli]